MDRRQTRSASSIPWILGRYSPLARPGLYNDLVKGGLLMLTKQMSEVACVSALLMVSQALGQERSRPGEKFSIEEFSIRVNLKGPLNVEEPIRTDPVAAREYGQRTGV